MPIEDQPKDNDAMQQTNQGNAKGWQTEVKGGTAYIAETIIQVSSSPDAGSGARTIDFQPYLRSIIADEKYQQKWGFYTPTDAIGQLQEQKQPSTVLDIGLMVQLMQPKQAEEAQNPERQEKTERLPVLEGIRKYAAEHVLLMGRPGSGKSTALLRLLVDEAHKALADPSAKVPVLVELRYLDAERPSMLERIGAFLQSHHLSVEESILKAVLAEGKLLLLIDGVNELPSEAARRIVARFRQDYPKTPMIFTTRDVAIGGDVGIEKKLEMQPLSEAQMRQFVQAYLPEQGEPMLRQLQGRLREVGQTPLLLWMLCEVFRGLQQLPSSLGLLFRWFAGEYDKLKQDVPVSPGLRHWQAELLQHLAFTMMQADEPTELRVSISRPEAEAVLAAFLRNKEEYPEKRAKEWLEDLLEYHLLQRTSQNQLEFHHQLLQEYYAAEALLQRLPQLSDEELKRDYLNYLKWTEPIALMLALVEEEAEALRVVKLAMEEVDLMLGARLAGEVKPAFQTTTISWIDVLQISLGFKCQCWVTSHSKEAVPGLLKALENQDFNVRSSAAEALGQLGSPEAVPGLLKALENQDSNVRKIAAEALGKLDGIEAISNLLKALKHWDFSVRKIAVEALGKIGSEQAIPGLLNALNDENLDVCWSAAEALGKIGSEQAVVALSKALQISYIRWKAAEALGKIGSEQAVVALSKALENQNVDIRIKTAEALGGTASKQAVPGLLNALNDRDSDVRSKAAEALGKIGNEQAIPELLNALEDQNPSVRSKAAEALGKIGSEQAIPGLLKALKHKNFFVRGNAAYALGKIGSEQVIPELLNVLNDKDSDVRSKAAEALGKIGNEQAIPELLNALEDQNPSVRSKAAEALGKIGSEQAIAGLLNALKHQNFFVRWSAAEALEKIGSKRAIPELLTALTDQNSSVRTTAAEALGKIGSEQAIAGLLKALEDQFFYVRWSAARALGKIGSEQAIAGLLKALEDQDSSVRESVAEALGKIGGEQAIAGLLKILEARCYEIQWKAVKIPGKISNKNESTIVGSLGSLNVIENHIASVRQNAVYALGEIGSEQAIPALLQALEDQAQARDVRISAASALGKLGSPEAIAGLLRVFGDQDFYVYDVAARILKNIGNSELLAQLRKQQFISSVTYYSVTYYSVISGIQNRCKFYNHEIAQTALDL